MSHSLTDLAQPFELLNFQRDWLETNEKEFVLGVRYGLTGCLSALTKDSDKNYSEYSPLISEIDWSGVEQHLIKRIQNKYLEVIDFRS